MTIVVGTAGHIDHGKTTLLRALTGIDADRLPEERARGMTIDVGYAHLALPDGTELDFVDVPGHDRLVGNMLVGAGEIDAALLVVAADDGPRAQTIEHLHLLDALGIADGVAVITKTDAVPAERIAEVGSAVARLLAGTTLEGSAIVPVSGLSGAGLPDLRDALAAMRDRVIARGPASGSAPRLAIDRVFSIRGRGTVVTGTLGGGTLARGALLRVVPGATGATIRVREVQVHHRTVEMAGPGRVALNVAGPAVGSLARGTVLTTDPAVVASDRVLVALRGSEARALPADRARVSLHLGTAHVPAIVGRTGRDAADLADGCGTAILRLEHSIAVAPGDWFALRRPSPAAVAGGGWILDPEPPRGIARRRATDERLAALAAATPGSEAWAATRLELHGALSGRLAPDVAVSVDEALLGAAGDGDPRRADMVRAGERELRRQVGGQADAAPAVAGRIEALVASGALVRDGDRLRLPGAASGASPEQLEAMDRLEALLRTSSPPPLSEAARAAGCPPAGIAELERAGRIVRLEDDLAWASDTWRELASRALAMSAVEPLTPAAFRDATGTSRKYVMAILEDLDRRAILRRVPVGHVPGPRAAQLAAAVPR